MKIQSIHVFQKTYTMRGGTFVISGGKVASHQDSTIVRIQTDEGLVGWGEQCVFSPNYLVAHGEGARAAISLLAPKLIGMDPRQPEIVYEKMDATLKGHDYAKSAVDIACWDLFGKATGLSIAELLGGVRRTRIPLYAPVSMASPKEMQADCQRWVSAGYSRFQMKVGGDYATDMARIESCLDAVGGAEKIIFDANGNWTQFDAIQIVAAVEGERIFIEQPCATAEECARVRERSALPFILDESLLNSFDILSAYKLKAMDAVMLKLSRFGGITPIKKARELAALLGLGVSIEDSGGGDIVTAAMAHLSASTPDRTFVNGFFTGSMVNERISEWGCSNSNGFGDLPVGVGLGIEVDAEKLGEPLAVYC